MTGDNCTVCGERTRYDGHEIAHSCAGGAPVCKESLLTEDRAQQAERDHGLVSISEMNRRIAEGSCRHASTWVAMRMHHRGRSEDSGASEMIYPGASVLGQRTANQPDERTRCDRAREGQWIDGARCAPTDVPTNSTPGASCLRCERGAKC